MGFVTPEEVWARESGGAEFRARLSDAVAACQGIVSPDTPSFFEGSLAGKRPYDSAIWRILCLGAWMRLFSVTV
jgi:hypothetical protein